MTRNDIWYHLYPLGFLGAEDRNPCPGAEEGPVTSRLGELDVWLDYLVELGVTGVMLAPVFESESHGYDVVDPFRVDRRLGTEADLIRFIEECHARSLQVALDLVLHHVGRAHPHFVETVEQGRDSQWKDWFLIDFNRPGRDGFSYADFEGHGGLVKLNHGNGQVLDWAVEAARYWADRGVDAFRLDAAYAIPTSFLSAFSDRLRGAHPEVVLIGEVIHGDYASFVESSHVTTVTQYELWKAIWSGLNDRNFFELSHALERHAQFSQRFSPWTFVGNHDTTRIATKLNDRRHVTHALAVLLTIPGMPAIYAGDEQGAEGMKYDRAGGDDEIRKPLPYRPADLGGDKPPVWRLHQELITMRKARPWLATGQLEVTRLDNRAIQLQVRSDQHCLVTALSTEDQEVEFNIPHGLEPLTGSATGGPGATKLPPHGWGIWST